MTTRLALVGFGRVGRAFAGLLLRQRDALLRDHGLDARVTAILTGHHGWTRNDAGIDLEEVLALDDLPNRDARPLIAALSADVLVEVTTFEPSTGEPALDHLRDALRSGMHVITANKGPIAHAYRELDDLARERGRALRFEATVADDLPVFNLVRRLPTAKVLGLRGIVNGATNYILSVASRGATFAKALADVRRMGIAERDTSADLDGWDAAAKATILASVLLRRSIAMRDVARERITPATAKEAAAVARRGKRVRPLLMVNAAGAWVGPATLSHDDPLFAVDGSSTALEIETDVAGTMLVSLRRPAVEQTAFALLSDLVDVAGDRTTITR